MYDMCYALVCGTPPTLRPWHFQWLAIKDLYRELRVVVRDLEGRVLDVGCGRKPYRKWFEKAGEYVGLDVTRESDADVIVRAGERWPFEDSSFDAVVSTQVLEHVSDFANVRAEIARVVKPGGQVIISVPFIYNEHGAPEDFRRFSVYGAAQLFPADWEVVRVARLGGAGSSLGILFLNWIDISLSSDSRTKLVKVMLLPLWIVLSAIVNAVGSALDKVGDKSATYVNLLVVFAKPGGTSSR
jgi:SAM-dependent methyltransferase